MRKEVYIIYSTHMKKVEKTHSDWNRTIEESKV